MLTFVFALEDAFARISAKCPLSPAFIPNAVSASVTMSEVKAKSSPDAAARFIMPSMPLIISPAFQPAIAMYVSASAASDALNLVVAPISKALLRSMLMAVDVASPVFSKERPISFACSITFARSSSDTFPEMADTSDMVASNSMPAFTAAAPKPPTAADIAPKLCKPFTATSTAFCPTPSTALKPSIKGVRASFIPLPVLLRLSENDLNLVLAELSPRSNSSRLIRMLATNSIKSTSAHPPSPFLMWSMISSAVRVSSGGLGLSLSAQRSDIALPCLPPVKLAAGMAVFSAIACSVSVT